MQNFKNGGERQVRGGGLYGVMTEVALSDGAMHYVYMTSAEDRERARDTGVEVCRTGQFVSMRPVMSRADYHALRFGTLPAVTGHEDMLYPFLQPGTEKWAQFVDTRKIVEFTQPGFKPKVAVVSNMRERLTRVDPAGDAVRSYRLTQVLTDPAIQHKFGLTTHVVYTLRDVAVARPDAAARQATELLSRARPDLNVVVSADGYSRSRRRARDAIALFCDRFPQLSVTQECRTIGKDIFFYGGGSGGPEWHVSGPMELACEVALVHRAVEHCGGAPVMFALGSEFVTLRIDICEGDRYLSPEIELHIGTPDIQLPTESSPLTSALLSVEGRQRLQAMRAALAEVRKDGVLVATCVRISRKYALMSSHVADEPGILVDGEHVVRVKTVAPELWLVSSECPTPPAWPLREACEGERVVVCYRGPTGDLQYTSPLSVLSAGPEALTLSRSGELAKGMSGGAIVALEDLALLGVYEGAGRQQALGLTFSPAMFADAHSVSGQTPASRVDGLGVFQKMRERGLGQYVDQVLAAVTPLYNRDVHVGHAFRVGGRLLTACNPDASPLSERPGGQPLLFKGADGFLFESEQISPGPQPGCVRRPQYYERVVIVGRDEQGPYYSGVTRVVHVGVNGANFSLESVELDGELPFNGGLVMSLVDAAVLGVYVRESASAAFGIVEFCSAIPRLEGRVVGGFARAATALREAFPELRPAMWPDGLLEEVFVHGSCSSYQSPGKIFNGGFGPLARLGRHVIGARFAELAREGAFPLDRWTDEFQRTLSQPVLAQLAERFGLSRHVRFGQGTSRPPPGSNAYADLVAAVAGAVYIAENGDVCEDFVDVLLLAVGSVVVKPLREGVVSRLRTASGTVSEV